jgi:plastocyanin
MSRHLVAVACAVSLLAVAGCGGDSDDSSSDETAPANATVVKAVEGIAWDSRTYSATAVDGKISIVGENDSTLPHNLYVIAQDGTELPSSVDLPRKGSDGVFSASAAPGTYTIICKIPGHNNMKAELTVS